MVWVKVRDRRDLAKGLFLKVKGRVRMQKILKRDNMALKASLGGGSLGLRCLSEFCCRGFSAKGRLVYRVIELICMRSWCTFWRENELVNIGATVFMRMWVII
jgi:hypothetical protein